MSIIRPVHMDVQGFQRQALDPPDSSISIYLPPDTFFPFIETRVKLPPKMSSDHEALISMLDQCKALVEALAPMGSPAQDHAAVMKLQVRSSWGCK